MIRHLMNGMGMKTSWSVANELRESQADFGKYFPYAKQVLKEGEDI